MRFPVNGGRIRPPERTPGPWIGTPGLTCTMQDYGGAPIDENEWRGDLGVEYFLSRKTVLFSRYRHAIFESTSRGAEYTFDVIHGDLRLRRPSGQVLRHSSVAAYRFVDINVGGIGRPICFSCRLFG
jgi:hypothetical protein